MRFTLYLNRPRLSFSEIAFRTDIIRATLPRSMRAWLLSLVSFVPVLNGWSALEFLESRFDLPANFRIYRVAGPELSGGSYDLCFDGEGLLLVGDGNAVRRLADKDDDGIYDSFEVIATGLGPRGPQGLLVDGDRLYAVGGDGVQVFESYRVGGALKHRGRIGNKFNTGGDHDAHTILRGHDGYLYLMAGNGSGIRDRAHITESNSPAMFERQASVFRISPDGQKWECVGSGGRNPPSLGMNSLGELFSFDSDMEWHVGLPWYRPVRLNHWVAGGDQGWQEVGAYPPYYIDCVPGILNIGRGSPDWGVFYEHTALPEKYQDAFLVCDYRWKRESNDQYATTGRLVAFFLQRAESGWKASMEVLARPKPGARDSAGKSIQFALVDVEVAPDGSLFLSDHNQGIWRILYATNKPSSASLKFKNQKSPDQDALETLLRLPQPSAEFSRVRAREISGHLGTNASSLLESNALEVTRSLARKLRSIRELAPDFARLSPDFLQRLAKGVEPDIRAQAAWLLGLRGEGKEVVILRTLLTDREPFVRRRAAEAFTRFQHPDAITPLIQRLSDPDRLIAYVCMVALAHYPSEQWMERVIVTRNLRTELRGLTAAHLRRESISSEQVNSILGPACDARMSPEAELDFLRVVTLYRKQLNADVQRSFREYLTRNFQTARDDLRWEQIRLVGEFDAGELFGKVLNELEHENDHIAQFHIAQALARLAGNWTADEETRLVRWFLKNQEGWFAQFTGKGVEFPMFWQTVLSDLGAHHSKALLAHKDKVDYSGLLGAVTLELIAKQPGAAEELINLYRTRQQLEVRTKVVRAMRNVSSERVSEFLRSEFVANPDLRNPIALSLASQAPDTRNQPALVAGLASSESEVVRACAKALTECKLDRDLARTAISQILERANWFHAVQDVLIKTSGTKPADCEQPSEPNRRPNEVTHRTSVAFWKAWYEKEFGEAFTPINTPAVAEKSNEEIYAFLLSDRVVGGNAARGARVYENLQCNSCHGGGVTPGLEGKLFGPDLAGVGRRLTKADLADSLVYPSKRVEDRFKAFEVELTDATPLTGFITEQNDMFVTLADREQVHRIPRAKIRSTTPQKNSLMPERLINRLSWDEIRDMMAFLEEGSK